MTTTPEQRAALAELFGITPETHRHLRILNQYCASCGKKEGFLLGETRYFLGDTRRMEHRHNDNDSWCGPVSEEWTLNHPDPLGADADAVWLAPAMCWFVKHEYEPLISGNHMNAPCYACITIRTGDVDSEADTFTAALLQACLSARVPEVCRAMEVTK